MSLVGGVAFIGLQVGLEYRERADDVRAAVTALASGVGTEAGRVLREAENVAYRVSAHPTVLSRDAEACAAWLRELAGFLPNVASLRIETDDGAFRCAAGDAVGPPETAPGAAPETAPGAAPETAPGTAPGLSGNAAGQAGSPGRLSRREGPGVDVPVRWERPAGGSEWAVPVRLEIPGGQVEILLRTRTLDALLASTITGAGQVLVLLDSTGIDVARSADPESWAGRNVWAAGATRPPEGESGVFRGQGADGVDRIWGYAWIPETPWIIMAGEPSDAVWGPVRAMAARQGLLTLGLLALFGVLLLGAGQVLARSLGQLTSEAAEARLHPGSRVMEEGPLEVVAMARALNQTLEARDEARVELAGTLERHELVLRASRDMIWDWDMVRGELHANNALLSFLGGDVEALTSPYRWFERIPEPDRSRVRESLEQALARGSSLWVQEYPMADARGGRAQILDRGYVVRAEDGRPVRVVGVMSDVTEARRRSDEVQRSKERYESIVRNAPFAVFLCSEDGRLLESNPALLAILGAEESASPSLESIPEVFVDPGHFQSLEKEAREKGVVIGREALWRRVDGNEIFVRLTLTTFEEKGAPRLEGLVEDITDRRRLGEQLRHAQKMEAVGRLAGGVAHDFNNLLTVITGESRILLGSEGLNPDGRESVEAIQEAGERGSALTRQLLAFSRRQVLDLVPLDVNDVMTRVERMLSRLLGEVVTLRLEPAPALPPVVADAGELEQVILNLAVNARDAMPDGGEVVLRTGHRILTEAELDQHPGLQAGPYVTLSVSDTGSGIDHAIVSRIFEPFFTTKAVGKGTGLGLSMVYGIISRLGGKVEVETEPGEGTTFRLFLPVAREGAAAPAPRPLSSPRALGGDGRIVVVEDEATVRRMALRILERAGYDVVTFGHPEEALKAFGEADWEVHLLLTDVRMPGMHGSDLADRVHEARPRLPVIYMSGYPEEAAIAERILSPNAAFLAKPFTPEALLNAIRRMLNINSTASPGSPTDRASRTR